MGWDKTMTIPVKMTPLAYSDVAATSESLLIAGRGYLKNIVTKLSAAVPATKTLLVEAKVNGTVIASLTVKPTDSTNAVELSIRKEVAMGDVITVTLTGFDSSVTGTATMSVGLDGSY